MRHFGKILSLIYDSSIKVRPDISGTWSQCWRPQLVWLPLWPYQVVPDDVENGTQAGLGKVVTEADVVVVGRVVNIMALSFVLVAFVMR